MEKKRASFARCARYFREFWVFFNVRAQKGCEWLPCSRCTKYTEKYIAADHCFTPMHNPPVIVVDFAHNQRILNCGKCMRKGALASSHKSLLCVFERSTQDYVSRNDTWVQDDSIAIRQILRGCSTTASVFCQLANNFGKLCFWARSNTSIGVEMTSSAYSPAPNRNLDRTTPSGTDLNKGTSHMLLLRAQSKMFAHHVRRGLMPFGRA